MLSIINKILFSFFMLFSYSSICIAEERSTRISVGDVKLSLPNGYILNSEFTVKAFPKFTKYEENVLSSSIFIKDISKCINLCLEGYKGEVSDDYTINKLIFNDGVIKSSLWEIESQWGEEGTKSTIGIIYNDNVLIQIMDNEKLWYSWSTKVAKSNRSDK